MTNCIEDAILYTIARMRQIVEEKRKDLEALQRTQRILLPAVHTLCTTVTVTPPNGETFEADACIVPALNALWAAGIETGESCCGHGRQYGFIALRKHAPAGNPSEEVSCADERSVDEIPHEAAVV